jgi:hypothetical protein
MWRHYCPAEHAWISVEDSERCNWCDEQDPVENFPRRDPAAAPTRSPGASQSWAQHWRAGSDRTHR